MPQQNMQELAHALFQYIKEVCQLTQKEIFDVDKQPAWVLLSQLDDPACVKLYSRDTVDDETVHNDGKLFSFRKPEFTVCPAPDASLLRWLQPDWENYRKQPEYKESILPPQEEATESESEVPEEVEEKDAGQLAPQPEFFKDDPARIALYKSWLETRNAWVEREKHTERLRDTFTDLYTMNHEYSQQPDALEIVIGNGLLTDKENKEIHHPLFFKRVQFTLDAVNNTLELYDTDEPPQMYLSMFSDMEGVNVDIVRPLEQKAIEQNIHPLDHHECGDFLRSVTHLLYASNCYLNENEQTAHGDERIVVRWEPYIILRKKPNGIIKALETILTDVDQGAPIPPTVGDILGGTEKGKKENTEEAENDAVSDEFEAHDLPLEDEEILLPKPANREQMEIVRKIEHSSTVLVQGPPGTGKTHTIANLLGHFLAQGKTVLVTSQTSKALMVLKDKVPKELQPLCVAAMGDNQADMQRSIDSIIEHTTTCSYASQRRAAEQLKASRHQTLTELTEARKLVYAIRHKEFEPIVYEGESWSTAKAAAYVAQRESLMTLIPAPVKKGASFPIAPDELQWLYASNEQLTTQEEHELAAGLPSESELMSAAQFAEGLELQQNLNLQLQNINAGGKVHLVWKPNRYAVVDQLTDQNYAQKGDAAAENALRDALTVYTENAISAWAVFAMADGAEDGLARKRWEQLISLIDETYTKAQPVLEGQLTKPVKILAGTYETLTAPFSELLTDAQKHGQVKKGLFMAKEKKNALDAVTIADKTPTTLDDMQRVTAFFEVQSLRERLGLLWDSLIATHGTRRFADLGNEPERICHQQLKAIEFWVNWYRKGRTDLCNLASKAGLGDALTQPVHSLAMMTDEKAAAALRHITNLMRPAVYLLHLVNALYSFTHSRENTLELLKNCSDSVICADLQVAIEAESAEQYEAALNQLSAIQEKEEVQRKRTLLLDKISECAPAWANSIRNRTGEHGNASVPENIIEAWKVHQLSMLVDEIINTPLRDAEKRVTDLTAKFRKETEKLASAQAWLHLQYRIDRNPQMRQILNGWKMTVTKIGKGTGKNAPALREEARKLMIQCQAAVPAWIMPVSNVMNSVDPAETKYDIVIVDEASQSDITAAAILYMGKKIIVVGDNEQVSPMAVGIDDSKIQSLMTMFIKGKIPNAHLWDAKMSLYDIAELNYRPLMLREHFRCVPDIIGYCNMLSYEGKIKPLREAGSSPFKTAMVSYRVNGTRRGRGKINEEEAAAVVALIQACLEQPEYANKSFGVISLLGDDQTKLIERKLYDAIPIAEYERHHILCGNASNFQGDERDVIFLSMVDSNNGTGPLSMASGEGQGSNGKAMKQRYNVAVSRAKDQLWVVHSLDYTADLKPGDMRRRLLEYVTNLGTVAAKASEIEEASDSPFEAAVAKALVGKGYHIVQQWQVGAYYIDMIAICGKKRIAIECDGERWHSGDKIREDMERQAILERLGWRFIRIRGSEYYRNPAQTIDRVVSELIAAGIQPEASDMAGGSREKDALLEKVKMRAGQLLCEDDSEIMHEDAAPQVEIELQPQQEPPVQAEQPSERQAEQITMPFELVDLPPIKEKEPEKPKESREEQLAMPLPEDDLLAALTERGFRYLDNRKSSGLLWVYYDSGKVGQLIELRNKFGFQSKLEKRGAKATGNQTAWCITWKK